MNLTPKQLVEIIDEARGPELELREAFDAALARNREKDTRIRDLVGQVDSRDDELNAWRQAAQELIRRTRYGHGDDLAEATPDALRQIGRLYEHYAEEMYPLLGLDPEVHKREDFIAALRELVESASSDPRPLKAGQKVRITGGHPVASFEVGDVVTAAEDTDDDGDTFICASGKTSYLWAKTTCELVPPADKYDVAVFREFVESHGIETEDHTVEGWFCVGEYTLGWGVGNAETELRNDLEVLGIPEAEYDAWLADR